MKSKFPLEDKFEILSVKVRPKIRKVVSKKNFDDYGNNYADVRVIFTVSGLEKEAFVKQSEDAYQTTSFTDLDLRNKYLDSLDIVFDYDNATEHGIPIEVISTLGIEKDKVFQNVWVERHNVNWNYLEKQNIFTFFEYVTWTPTTQAAITELQALARGINYTNFTDATVLRRLLETLQNFWH